jgi:hypothetical protein
MKKTIFCSLKINEERSRIRIQSRILIWIHKSEVLDPGIRIQIHSNMSRIPNTGIFYT